MNSFDNHLKPGSSEDVIEHNIIVLMSKHGYSETRAVQTAIRMAKQHSRGKNSSAAENPISNVTKYALVYAAVVGVGVVAYELLKKPATTKANAITLAPGAMSATIGSGLTINLPSGAVWAPGFQGAGTATPLQVPASPTTVGQSQTTPLTWTDSTGTPQTTMLTLTA